MNPAIDDFNRALQLDPYSANAYLSRGNAYSQTERLKEALSDYSRAIDLKPDLAEAYRVRGTAYRKTGDQARGQADLLKFAELTRKLNRSQGGQN